MATAKLKHPAGGVQTFEFGHAQRILKIQSDRNYPKASRWVMVKEQPNKKDTDDSNTPADIKPIKKAKGEGTSGS